MAVDSVTIYYNEDLSAIYLISMSMSEESGYCTFSCVRSIISAVHDMTIALPENSERT